MKRLALLLVCVALSIGATYPKDELSTPKQEFVPILAPRNFGYASNQLTTAKEVVDNAIPRIAVRWDDGRDNTMPQIAAFLRLGIPVTLALNADQIGTAGNLTWENVRTLRRFAVRKGAGFEIAQHSNNNFDGNPWSLTGYQDLVDEFTTDSIVAQLGEEMRPRVFVSPGEAANRHWMRRHRDVVASVLDSLGFEFAVMANGHIDSTGYTRFYPAHINTDTYTGLSGGASYGGACYKPGDVRDPFWIPGGATKDLGNMIVERDGTEVGEFGSVVDSWLLKDKAGVGGSPTADFYQTWSHYYSVALAENLGFMIAMHDSAATDDAEVSGLTGTGVGVDGGDGHFSPTHIAWTIKKLWEKGHIKPVLVSEWCRWVTGEYKDGIDLIANPGCLIPQHDIGDTNGVEMPWVRGLGMIGHTTTSYTSLNGNSGNPVGALPVGSNAKYDRTETWDPFQIIGENVTGYMGRTGGIQFASSNNTRLNISKGNLRPGHYRFSIATDATADIQLLEMHFAVALRAWLTKDAFEKTGTTAYADTVVTYVYRDANLVMSESAGDWRTMEIEFEIPEGIPGDGFGADFYGGPDVEYPGLYERNWLTSPKWALTFQLQNNGNNILSYPTFRYWRD